MRSRYWRHSGAKVLAGALVGAVLLAACGDDSNSGTAESAGADQGQASQEQTDVKLLLPAPAAAFAAALVAQQRYWKEAGLNVEPVVTDGSSVVAQQLAAGNAKYGIADAAAVYLADTEGGDLVGIAEQTHDGTARLSVPEDSSIQSVSDLKGEAIGIPSAGDGSVPIVKAVVEHAGLEPDKDVRFVIVGQGGPAVAQALKSGRIAAYAHGSSDVAGLEINGGVRLRSIMPPEFSGLPGTVLAISRDTLKNPADLKIAEKLARGWIQAGIFTRDHLDETFKIACEADPQTCQNEELAKLQVKISGETSYPTNTERPGYIDPAKAQTLIEAVADDMPVPIDQVFPDTSIDEISRGLTG